MTAPLTSTFTRADIEALFEGDRVHRDLYVSESLFALEREHFFGNTWIFAGHASQLPKAGDFITVEIAGQSLILVRQADTSVRAFHNRCAHKGAQISAEPAGNAGRFLRCPYHAWSYKLDGSPLARPMKGGYEGTRLAQSESGRGLEPVKGFANYRDFLFVKLNAGGMGFEEYCGDLLRVIDSLVDRSPTGRLVVAGGVLRSVVRCNWKMYLENINDTVHPVSAHESASASAANLWAGQPADAPKPMAVEQLLPFAESYDFFDRMGGRVHPNGHSVLGTQFSIHSGYGQQPEYEAALRAAHGEERARQVLTQSPQNAVIFPSLSIKCSPQVMRVIRPLAVDRTIVEAWSFRVEGGPEMLLQRGVLYNQLVFSPMSVVAQDDLHLFESAQRALRSGAHSWVSLHRDHREGEAEAGTQDVNGTNEMLMRNQFRAWVEFMAQDLS